MTTNKEWLFSLPLEEQYAWMNAEHYEANPDCSPMVYQAYTGNMMADGSSDESCESESGFWTVARWLDGPLSGDDDSREKLEAWAHEEVAEKWAQSDREVVMLMDDLRDMLDRQAAITRLESLYQFEENHRWHIRSIEEVRDLWIAKANEVREENEKLHEELEAAIASKLCVMEERDRLADELLTATREREMYRKLLSRAIDNAYETTMLLDEGAA